MQTSRGKLLVQLAAKMKQEKNQINDNGSQKQQNDAVIPRLPAEVKSQTLVVHNISYNSPNKNMSNAEFVCLSSDTAYHGKGGNNIEEDKFFQSKDKNFFEQDIINAEFIYLNDDLITAANDKDELNDKEINLFKGNDRNVSGKEDVIDVETLPPNDDLIAVTNDKDKYNNEEDNFSQVNDNNNRSANHYIAESNEDMIMDTYSDDGRSNSSYPEENINIEPHNNVPEDITTRQVRKRSKRQHVNEKTWNVKKQKINREKGLEYKGRTKVDGKSSYNADRSKRKLKLRCKCSLDKKTPMKCFNFSENDRKNIFNKFWEKSWAEKKVYVQLLTDVNPIKRVRDRKVDTVSRRGCSFKYFLKKNDERLRVCKTFFLNTLDIGEWSVRTWKQEALTGNEGCSSDNEEKSNKSLVRQDLFQNRKLCLKQFFDSLVKTESHYCRASSKKLYLEPLWQSKIRLYNFYVEDWCKSKNETPLSIAAFALAFENENLSLYAPKKDLCDLCVAYNTKNLSEEDFRLHQLKKEEARQEKNRDKENEPNVFTMDLQTVLLSPKSNVSSMYYKTKLAVHNFTLYNLKNKDGYCFIWNETEGNLTAQEFSSTICKFILSILPLDENKITLYSDGCGYQNRNVTLSNSLLNLSMTENITIQQKFLEKGHTQMEVDSMHSSIERILKNADINIPADYINICAKARRTPKPYAVHYLEHQYFKDLTAIQFFPSIRPGNKVGDAVVTDIRAIKYSPDGNIFYKLRFTDNWNLLNVRKNKNCFPRKFEDLPQLHTRRIKIKKTKFDHLQAIKTTLPVDYHDYYDNVSYQ